MAKTTYNKFWKANVEKNEFMHCFLVIVESYYISAAGAACFNIPCS